MLKFAIKDLRLFISDRRALLMTFFMPIALISIFAMAFGGERERNSRPVPLLVSDLDNSMSTKDIIAQLDSLKSLEVNVMPLDSAQRLVRTGEESAVLVFHKGFKDSMDAGGNIPIELQFDQSKAAEIGILQQALMSNLMRMIGTKMIMKKQMEKVDKQFGPVDPKILENIHSEIEKSFAENGAGGGNDNGVAMKLSPLIEEKQNSPGLIQAVAGTAVMMLLFGLVAMGAGLLEEKENGTLKKLLYAPIDPSHILFGKMIASILVALLQLTVLFLYASFMFKLDLMMNLPALIVMMLTTSYACAGFGMFLASVAKSRQQVQMLSSLIVLTMSAVGGSMIPTFIMPAFMQKISMFSINYWSIQGFYDIYWRALPFSDPAFLMRPLVLTIIGTVMMGISLVFFKRNVLKLA